MTPRYSGYETFMFLGQCKDYDLYYRNEVMSLNRRYTPAVMATNGHYLPLIYLFDTPFMQFSVLYPAITEAVKRAYQMGLIR